MAVRSPLLILRRECGGVYPLLAGAIVGNVGLPYDVEISAFALFGRNIGVHGNPTPVCAYLPKQELAGHIPAATASVN